MRRKGLFIGIIVGIVFIFFLILWGVALRYVLHQDESEFGFRKAVAVVDVKGDILSSDKVVKEIEKYDEDSSVRAIVLRVNSPGGGIAQSQEIYEAVKKADKDIVASLGSIAASGGYYISCGADRIIANPGTITGSIGVITTFPKYHQLLKKIGVEYEVIKSGEHKDIGSPYREMTEDEKRLLQDVIDDLFDQFVEVVSVERDIPKEEVLKLADGRILSGNQAHEQGLVDEIGTFSDAVRIAGELGGIEGKPRVIRPKKKEYKLLDLLLKTADRVTAIEDESIRFEYRMLF
jgi:protease-4